MKEGNFARLVILEASKRGHRIWINARGRGWVGNPPDKLRPITFGLGPNGTSDLIGFTRDGRFLAIETKTKGKYATDEQWKFIDYVRKAGGYAGVAYTMDQATSIMAGGDGAPRRN